MSVSAIDLASSMQSQKQRPPYVTFERRAVEDKAASKEAGRYIAKDVDYAIIMAPYSDGKESVIMKVTQWFANLEQDVKSLRYPGEWLAKHQQDYERFRQGQAIPLNGTPIKGWGVLSPAQQEMLIHHHILTVEDLAGINEVGMRAIGMGAMDLKRKAAAWLAQIGDKGPLTLKMADLERENELQKGEIETLKQQVRDLSAMVRTAQITAPPPLPEPTPAASMGVLAPSEFLPEPEPATEAEPPRRGPGRPRKVAVADQGA